MGINVVIGAAAMCSFGMAPSTPESSFRCRA